MNATATPTATDLHNLAMSAGWTKTCRRNGRTYYTTTTGRRAWLEADACSMDFWFLYNTSKPMA